MENILIKERHLVQLLDIAQHLLLILRPVDNRGSQINPDYIEDIIRLMELEIADAKRNSPKPPING